MIPYRQLRERANVTLSELARRTGIDRANLLRTEHAETSRVHTMLSYFAALGGTVTLTVSGGSGWIRWSPRRSQPPKDAIPLGIPDDEG